MNSLLLFLISLSVRPLSLPHSMLCLPGYFQHGRKGMGELQEESERKNRDLNERKIHTHTLYQEWRRWRRKKKMGVEEEENGKMWIYSVRKETRNSIPKSTHNTSFSIERTKLNLMFKKGGVGWKKLVAGGWRKKGKKWKEEKKKEERKKFHVIRLNVIYKRM